MKKLFLLPILVVLLSCNKTTPEEPPTNVEAQKVRVGYKITQEDALTIAESAPSLFVGDIQTKNLQRSILECVPVTTRSSIATKGGTLQTDTLMYLFNYADNKGYIFISTDERTGSVIAFIERGSFNMQDTATNELNKFLVTLMMDHQQTKLSELKNAEEELDYTTKGIEGNPGVPPGRTYAAYLRNGQGPMCFQVLKSDCNYGTPVTAPYEAQVQGDYYYKNKGCMATREFRDPDLIVGPLLTTQWDQGAPFNNNAPLIGTNRAAAGCTATATAQVMVYHSYPTKYPANINNGINTYVASLRKEKTTADFTSSASQNTVATFVRTVGNLIGNDWGYPETGGSQYNVPSSFAKMGYTNPSSVVAYNNTKILNSLVGRNPVIAIGWRQLNPKKGGHVWVIDGYNLFVSGYDNYYFDEYGRFNGSKYGGSRDNEPLLHCNFGWGGFSDGYYNNQIFLNYKYDLEIIPNIRP